MPVHVHVSQVIDRPLSKVYQFTATEHVRNHPRWDPFMQLEQLSAGPMGVGTIIKRINSRSGSPVEGRMEITEFEPDRAVGMVVHDGPLEMISRADYEALSADRTQLTFNVEIPGMDESMGSALARAIQESLHTIKRLIESEPNE